MAWDWVMYPFCQYGRCYPVFRVKKWRVFVYIYIYIHTHTHRVIKKSLQLMITYRKLQVMFKVSPASLQTFIDSH
jgi:hypothetical protein